MFTIVGLGNPGDEYIHTRHNIGQIVLRLLVGRHSLPSLTRSSHYSGFISEGVLDGVEVGVLLPTTYMNNSGTSVKKYIRETQSAENLIVVHDDVDLPFGEIKVSYDRGAGGHNGVKSIIDSCGFKSFVRIRVGIAKKGFFGGIKRPAGDKLSDFVLGTFSKSEEKEIQNIADLVDTSLIHILKEGISYAMQEGNGK